MTSTGWRAPWIAFTLSGIAGLVYELVWTRYLALLVGHSAYAQVLVLAVYLGGTAVGSLIVAERGDGLERPLRAYAAVEAALGVFGVLFHPLYRAATSVLYGSIAPSLGSSALAGLSTWAVAIALVIPQAILLGATFPLMAAGVVRGRPGAPGHSVAEVYLLNTLGGAFGVLLGGFGLVPRLGLPGAAIAAGLLNFAAAGLAWGAASAPAGPLPATDQGAAEVPAPRRGLVPLLLAATALSALASFLYEIGWTRMLALVMGSATHSFELMLSAFLLGLGFGAVLVRRRADRGERADDSLVVLASVQWAMGAAALLTVPIYASSFRTMAWLVAVLPRADHGYLLFNLSRYALGLAVMLPATLLAGMTLPLITGALLRTGAGERGIGLAYGANTLGSVVGAVAGGLFVLPGLGLKGTIGLGAALDMAVGVALLAAAPLPARRRLGASALAVGAAAALVLGVTRGVTLDRMVLTSGVYRHGELPPPGAEGVVFYQDGATATVGVHRTASGFTTITTNGKPDASLPIRWLQNAAGAPLARTAISGEDESTQVLSPLILLAFNPAARRAGVIGHGSGMSGEIVLGSPRVESMVTVEIEPAMILGSQSFMPANHRVFDDRRARFLLDDARSALAGGGEPFDLVFSEPSNPWVSGVATLFTVEFYERVRARLAPGGVFGQWFHLFEMDDRLILSVLAAIHRTFPDWSAWMVGEGDVLIVAGNGPLPQPDWSVVDLPGVAADVRHFPTLTPGAMESLLLFDARTLGPLLASWPANTDARPILDAEAERARFLGETADGLLSFGMDPINLTRTLARRPLAPLPFDTLPVQNLQPMQRRALAGWLVSGAVNQGPPTFGDWGTAILRESVLRTRSRTPQPDWRRWMVAFAEVESDRHGRSAGWVDSLFYQSVEGYLASADAPADVQASVALLKNVRALDFAAAAAAADRAGAITPGSPLLPPTLLLDAAVAAYLGAGRPESARTAFELLAPRTGRSPGNARNLVLGALVGAAP